MRDPSLAGLDTLRGIDPVQHARLSCRFAAVIDRLPQDREHEDMREHVMLLDAALLDVARANVDPLDPNALD